MPSTCKLLYFMLSQRGVVTSGKRLRICLSSASAVVEFQAVAKDLDGPSLSRASWASTIPPMIMARRIAVAPYFSISVTSLLTETASALKDPMQKPNVSVEDP